MKKEYDAMNKTADVWNALEKELGKLCICYYQTLLRLRFYFWVFTIRLVSFIYMCSLLT